MRYFQSFVWGSDRKEFLKLMSNDISLRNSIFRSEEREKHVLRSEELN